MDSSISGRSAAVDVEYLAFGLSYDALGQLERLDPAMGSGRFGPISADIYAELPVGAVIADRRLDAARECGQWESRNLSARLAAG